MSDEELFLAHYAARVREAAQEIRPLLPKLPRVSDRAKAEAITLELDQLLEAVPSDLDAVGRILELLFWLDPDSTIAYPHIWWRQFAVLSLGMS